MKIANRINLLWVLWILWACQTAPTPAPETVLPPTPTLTVAPAVVSTPTAGALLATSTPPQISLLRTLPLSGQLVATTADEQWVAVMDNSSQPPTLAVFNQQTGKIQWQHQQEHYGLSALAFSPDGRYLAAGGTHYDLLVWDVSNGQKLHQPPIPYEAITELSFSPDGQFLAITPTEQWDSSIPSALIWDMKTAAFIGEFSELPAAVEELAQGYNKITNDDFDIYGWHITDGAFLPNSNNLLVLTISYHVNQEVGHLPTAYVWDIQKDELTTILSGTWGNAVDVSPNGKFVVVQNDDEIVILDSEDFSQIGGWFSPSTYPPILRINNQGMVVYGEMFQSGVKFWDLNGQLLTNIPTQNIVDVVVTAQNNFFITIYEIVEENIVAVPVEIWAVLSPTSVNLTLTPTPAVFEGTSQLLPVELANTLWYTATQIITNLENRTFYTFAPNGQILATNHFINNETEGVLTVWDTQTGAEKWSYVSEDMLWAKIYFSPDSQLVGTAVRFGGVNVWQVNSAEPLYNLIFESNGVGLLSFSTDNRYLAVSTTTALQPGGWVIDLQNKGQIVTDFVSEGVAFIPHTHTVAIASGRKGFDADSSPLRLLEVETNQKQFLTPGRGYAGNVAVSSDGQFLITNGYSDEEIPENHILLWDLAEQKEVKQINLGETLDWGLTFSPSNYWGVLTQQQLLIGDTKGEMVAKFLPKTVDMFNFTPDGQYLLTQYDGEFSCWRLPIYPEQ